MKYLFLALLLG